MTLKPGESATVNITTDPEDWDGSFLIEGYGYAGGGTVPNPTVTVTKTMDTQFTVQLVEQNGHTVGGRVLVSPYSTGTPQAFLSVTVAES